MNQVGDDLGIGIGHELVALGAQALAHLFVVLDDAVVNHRHAVRNVRMGVLLRRHAMGGPARMRDPDVPCEAMRTGELLQLGDAAGRAHTAQLRPRSRRHSVEDRDPGGVVAAILEPLQPLDEDGNDVTLGDRPDYSAHAVCLSITSSLPAAASPESTPASRERGSARPPERPW